MEDLTLYPRPLGGDIKYFSKLHPVRFGEALRLATERMDQKNVYMVNPAFDRS